MNEKQDRTGPDAEQYARVILWHLCLLQSRLTLLDADTIRRAGAQEGASVEEILIATSKHGKQIHKHAEPLYREALRQANIKPSATFPHSGAL
jgi:hypothetical protein